MIAQRSQIAGAALTAALLFVTSCTHESHIAVMQASEPESRMPAIDACSVLARDEIEPILGVLKEGPTSATGLSNEKECKYANAGGIWLQTSLYGSDRWTLQKAISSEMHPKVLAGLGDEAFSVKRGTDSVVYVRKGASVLEISCSCDLARSDALAVKGIARIK
jgi:hypothetical protein